MARGRKRKHNPTIPSHIDQAKIPTGLYWDGRWGGSWYVFDRPAGERTKRRNVADARAALSDLHAIAEARAGRPDSKTLRGLTAAFEASPQFRRLAKTTRDDYRYCAKVVCEWRSGRGPAVGDIQTRRLTRPFCQLLIDDIAIGVKRDADGKLTPTPAKAVHVQRYLSRLFEWGANRGFNDTNPAEGLDLPRQRQRRRLPDVATMRTVIDFARAQAGGRGQQDSVAPYLWAVMEIAYKTRLRGIELCTLTDANALEDGVLTNRRKGSRDNITLWSDDLRVAWNALLLLRQKTWERLRIPTPLLPTDRNLVTTSTGQPLTKSGLDSAWQRMIKLAISRGILKPEERFGIHDLKRRGVTDTLGNRHVKQEASGHRSALMLDIYDLSVPRVRPAGEIT